MLAAAEREWVLMLYAAAWAVAGITALACMRRGALLLPTVLTVGMSMMWGAAWFIGWLEHPETTWWQTAATYWGPAIMYGSMVTMIPRKPLPVGADE